MRGREEKKWGKRRDLVQNASAPWPPPSRGRHPLEEETSRSLRAFALPWKEKRRPYLPPRRGSKAFILFVTSEELVCFRENRLKVRPLK